MNLKKLRTQLGLSQTEFGKELCMSLRQYQRCELANELQPQAQKILNLMAALKNIHGFINKKTDCMKIKPSSKIKVAILSSDLCEISKSIEGKIGAFIKKETE